ncbi:MAG: response regulator [Candidatus Saganbacteria bacterium]|nr:response regulator [Candidatus Saganbacteria bacterium]
MEKPLIMVVDDDAKVADRTARIIQQTEKYNIITAYSAKEGLEELSKNKIMFGLKGNRIRLIVLDIKMPEMDGLQFLEEIRKNYGGNIGVIMLTAYEDAEKWERATSGFIISYIKKPFDPEKLLLTIDKFFEGKEGEMTLDTFDKHIKKREEFEREAKERKNT